MIEVDKVNTLHVGHTGENDAEIFDFDFSKWIERYGEGQLLLSVKRPCDDMPYPATLDVKGNIATWIVKKTDVSVKGTGLAEFTYKVGSVIKKSSRFKFYVEQSFEGITPVPAEPQSWLDLMEAKALEGLEHANSAKQSAGSANLDAIAAEASRVVVDELAKAVDADAKEVAANKTTVVESKKAVDLADQRINASVEDVQLMQLDVKTNKGLVDTAKAEVDKKAVQVAKDTEETRFLADKVDQATGQSGYLFFNVVDGDLIMERTPNTAVDFSLKEGDLILNG